MEVNLSQQSQLTPAEFSKHALQAIEASEGRRKKRKRDTGPDLTGMGIKRDLLQRAISEEPSADEFEAWLLQQVITSQAGGPIRAMALEILADYQNACSVQSFGGWLTEGAPSPRVGGRPHRS
ncbi:MAG: type III secretion fhipep protein [Thermomicrobiaceae bacterium]